MVVTFALAATANICQCIHMRSLGKSNLKRGYSVISRIVSPGEDPLSLLSQRL